MRICLSVALLAAMLCPSAIFAAGPNDADQLAQRIEQLETQTQALRKALEESQRRIERLPAVATPAAVDPNAEPGSSEFFTLDELRGEMADLVWRKGDFKIVPYGVIWGSALYQTQRTVAGPYTLFAQTPDLEGESAFYVDARRTRIGVNIAGPDVPMFCCAKSGGKIEIDFFGYNAVENKPGVLLRHAYAEIKNDYFRILGGQTWDIISPLNPGTLNYPVGWGAGNIGYRRAQVRVERYLHFSDTVLWTLQGSINQDVVSDRFANCQPETSDWPVLEGRVAVTLGPRGAGCKPMTLGFSGHIGDQQYDIVAGAGVADDYRVRTWSFNVDLNCPITDRFGVKGEFFTGSNLGTFLGGIVQGVNLASANHNAIHSTGGWVDVWYDVTPRLHTHFGGGIDDPRNQDLTAATGRIYNSFIFGNVSFDLTKKMNVGVEVTKWNTHFVNQTPGESVVIEFVGKYAF